MTLKEKVFTKDSGENKECQTVIIVKEHKFAILSEKKMAQYG